MTRRRSSAADPADGQALDLFAAETPPAAPASTTRPDGAPPRPASTAASRVARSAESRPEPLGSTGASPELERERPPLDPPGSLGDFPGSSARTAVAISTLTATAREVLEGAFLPLWVRGEVSDFKRHRNGHWYFSLRDASAQIRCVVWSRDQRAFPASPDDGMQVTALGQVTVYAARGDLQFTVRAMEAAGDGLWRKALERARLALEQDGLLAPERKRPLPRYPRRIAIITSPSGAALHDVISVAQRRWAAVELIVVPARVQGDGAPEELCAALDRVARWGGVDIVIIGRGGGAREDLWAFNDERVARAVAGCPIPTISAVGHEVDVTLCDLVADLRAATPSAAAEAAVPVLVEAQARLRRIESELRGAVAARLASAAGERQHLADALRRRAERLVDRRRARVQELGGRLQALSPLATLARGYGIARDDAGRTLGSVAAFREQQPFTLLLRDGSVEATARQVHVGQPGHDDEHPGARSGETPA